MPVSERTACPVGFELSPNQAANSAQAHYHDKYYLRDALSLALRRAHRYDEADDVQDCHGSFREYLPECKNPRQKAILHPISCFHRLCPFCATIRRERAKEHLGEFIKHMKEPKFLTVTVKNVEHIDGRYLKQWRGWFNRLRNKDVWKRAVRGGVYSLETTYNTKSRTWHVHLHALIDAAYMPQAWLSQAWEAITEGAGFIVDIRPIRGHDAAIAEAIKYITKITPFWDDPRLLNEFMQAVRGARLLGTFGTLYGQDVPDTRPPKRFPTCAGCGSTDPAHWQGHGLVWAYRVGRELAPDGRYYWVPLDR